MNRPTRDDPIAASLSEVVGGPVGDHARPHRWWTPVRVLLAVFTVVFALGLVQKYPCGETDWSSETVRYGKMCYSDVPYLYTGRGFAEQHWPYGDSLRPVRGDGVPGRDLVLRLGRLEDHRADAVGSVTDGARADATRRRALGLARDGQGGEHLLPGHRRAAVRLRVWRRATSSPERVRDARGTRWRSRRSPALLLAGLVNWDLLAVLFTAGALWAWARDRPVLAGVMVGLGVATKLYPLFLLGAFLVDVAAASQT